MGLTCSPFGTKNAYHNSVEKSLGKEPLDGLISFKNITAHLTEDSYEERY